MSQTLSVAVVGHTNVGKTSLMRTLTRNSGFGEVSAHPSTTRDVEGAQILVDGEPVLRLFDTPGLEDPISLRSVLEQHGDRRGDGIERIRAFLQGPDARGRFEQEAKVFHQVLQSDASLYVIDARDPVLGKHRDELQLLVMCARPILPVLNFLRADSNHETEWREALARAGLHAVLRFDSVAPERQAESRLMAGLSTLMQQHEEPLRRLVAAREVEAEARRCTAWQRVAVMLVDLAQLRVRVEDEGPASGTKAFETMRRAVVDREQILVADLLGLYRFDLDAVEAEELPLRQGSWSTDPFDADALGLLASRLGGGAAAGAAAGVGLDLAVGGITLGAAALGGALLGGGLQTVRHYGRRWFERWKGKSALSLQPQVLLHLLLRARHLVEALEHRGHGAVRPLRLDGAAMDAAALRLPRALRQAQLHPEWSAQSPARARAIDELARELA